MGRMGVVESGNGSFAMFRAFSRGFVCFKLMRWSYG